MWPIAIAYADSVDDFFFKVNDKILNPAIEFIFIVAFVVFMFGVMEFIRGANNDKKRTDGKQHMLWGIIGFVIMMGVFGIIRILAGTLGVTGVTVNNKEQKIQYPDKLQELKIPK